VAPGKRIDRIQGIGQKRCRAEEPMPPQASRNSGATKDARAAADHHHGQEATSEPRPQNELCFV
jgi:hypothetical protein